jgi:hypothetical protein
MRSRVSAGESPTSLTAGRTDFKRSYETYVLIVFRVNHFFQKHTQPEPAASISGTALMM